MAKKPAKSRAAPKKLVKLPVAKKTGKVRAKPKVRAQPEVRAKPKGATVAGAEAASSAVLDRLWDVIVQRRTADPALSHSARLLSRGTAKVAQKFGEEAVECLIEAVGGTAEALVAESADVLYHLLVLWVAGGIEPASVWAELERREGVSGVAEKAARSLPRRQAVGTRKIP